MDFKKGLSWKQAIVDFKVDVEQHDHKQHEQDGGV